MKVGMPIIYPQGKPSEILCMEGGGDCIFQEVNSGAVGIEDVFEKYGPKIYALVERAAVGAGVAPSFLHFVLYQPTGLWPPSLSKSDVKTLRFLSQIGLLYRLPKALQNSRSLRKRDIAENDELVAAMKLLAKQGDQAIVRPVAKDVQSIAQKSIASIQELCAKVYGEKCSFSEAKKIFFGDLRRGLKHRRLDLDAPNAMGTFLAL